MWIVDDLPVLSHDVNGNTRKSWSQGGRIIRHMYDPFIDIYQQVISSPSFPDVVMGVFCGLCGGILSILVRPRSVAGSFRAVFASVIFSATSLAVIVHHHDLGDDLLYRGGLAVGIGFMGYPLLQGVYLGLDGYKDKVFPLVLKKLGIKK